MSDRFYRTFFLVSVVVCGGAHAREPVESPVAATVASQPAEPDVLADVEMRRDIPYVSDGHPRQTFDLYLPRQRTGKLPVVVWIHGGGWSGGSKRPTPCAKLVDRGYAVASVGYRLTDVATFPAQIHDCAAAVRYLRGNADQLGIDPDRIGAIGSSAGGNLGLLLAVGGGVDALAGDLGDHNDQSSRINCLVDFFGTVEFRKPQEFPLNNNRIKYLGGTPAEQPERAALVTPLTHVSMDDSPVLIIHGDADRTVTISHSRALESALALAGVEHELVLVPGGGHGGEKFNTPEVLAKVHDFLDRHLKPAVALPADNPPTSR